MPPPIAARDGSTVRPRTEAVEAGQRHVVGDIEAKRDTFVLAIFADEAEALPPSLFRGGAPAERADADAPRPYRIEAENPAEELGPPGADEPRDSQNLTAMEGECRRSRLERVHLEQSLSGRARCSRKELADVAADHQANDLGRAHRRLAAARARRHREE